MLTAKIKRSDISQSHLEREIEDIKAHSMDDNVIINFAKDYIDYKESKGGNCVQLIGAFFKNVLGLTLIYILSAHRLGVSRSGVSRPMIARIPDSGQRADIHDG